MALKKVEQEEAVENQEFTEEAIGKLEDDEFLNEDDVKPYERSAFMEKNDVKLDDQTGEQSCWLSTSSKLDDMSLGANLTENNVLSRR